VKLTFIALLTLFMYLLGCGKEGASNQSLTPPKKEKPLSENFLALKALAEKGDSMAQNSLGMMYYHGEEVAENDADVMKWYRKAAEQGYAKAQYHLGAMYADGQGVLEDSKEAVKWYLAAAE